MTCHVHTAHHRGRDIWRRHRVGSGNDCCAAFEIDDLWILFPRVDVLLYATLSLGESRLLSLSLARDAEHRTRAQQKYLPKRRRVCAVAYRGGQAVACPFTWRRAALAEESRACRQHRRHESLIPGVYGDNAKSKISVSTTLTTRDCASIPGKGR